MAERFVVQADIVIEAEDLDDAFLQLSDHFVMMRIGGDDTPLEIISGTMRIEREKETTDV